MRTPQLLVILLCFGLAFSCKDTSKPEEKIENNATLYFGGDILTMVGDRPDYAEALVVQDGKIAFVGDLVEAESLAGNGHIKINLQGQTLLPGLIDGHAHFGSFSAQAIGAQICSLWL